MVILLGVAALAAIGWFLISPLFIDRPVEEAPPIDIPSREAVRDMSEAEQQAVMAKLMAQAEKAGDNQINERMDMVKLPTQVATRSFRGTDKLHYADGSLIIYERSDASHLLRFEDFRVTNGPALVVMLARHPAPRGRDDVRQGYVKLGELKGNVGNQNYEVPVSIRLQDYGSVVIWCELFDVLFASASINEL